mmetsp:Transcript_40055/g.115479  ORF Transcript_40055/g.115479 Transcript_40055/m.115479 type:complete len:212 (-) Transcript_40055:1196-1831(-)
MGGRWSAHSSRLWQCSAGPVAARLLPAAQSSTRHCSGAASSDVPSSSTAAAGGSRVPSGPARLPGQLSARVPENHSTASASRNESSGSGSGLALLLVSRDPICWSGDHVASCQSGDCPTSGAQASNALSAAARTSLSPRRPSRSSGSGGTRRSSNSSEANRPKSCGKASQLAMRSGEACHSCSSKKRLRFSGRSNLLISSPGNCSRRSGSP